jgi:hypothetical protein
MAAHEVSGHQMAGQSSPGNPAGGHQGPRRRGHAAALYATLFVLGAAEGLVGSFQYGQSPAPVVAIVLVGAILATCVFGGWGSGTATGAVAVAAGWVLSSFLLSMGTHQGSVIITNTAAGKWYLYGGALAACAGVPGSVIARARAGGGPPQGPRLRRPPVAR